ncbi:hypothetical protein [Frankia sp. Cas4]|uniref:hypothetical protein n=1 Tax=Frankia sp. Cas4 TaxID=3073927 RepID=UPI002AD43548|nr:hypothetical protein [Frankia sp. Cas4]
MAPDLVAGEFGGLLVVAGEVGSAGAVRRCGGAAVRRCGGAAVRRCGGAAVRRCGGAAVRRCGQEASLSQKDFDLRLED